MKIVLIEPLSISPTKLEEFKIQLKELGHNFESYDTKPQNEDEYLNRAKNADILMIANSPLPDSVIENAVNLKLINVAFTGFDHVNVELATSKGIKICNASGYSNTSVSELVIGLVLNIYRMIRQSDHFTRKGNTHASYYSGLEIKDKTVGIIGTGNIGIQTAKLFKAFGANLIAYSRSEKKEVLDLGIKYMSLEEVMENSDIVTIHLGLNDSTKGLINEKILSLMKQSAILVNCARGPVVDNIALAQALNNDKIAYAAIDVFDMEPPIKRDYCLINSKNTLLTPHIAYLTKESMIRRANIAFDNTISFINDEPQNIIN